VVMVDEVADSRPRLGQVQEHGCLQAFPPERPPEPLDLAERLLARAYSPVCDPFDSYL